jgi:hypothetical protein
MKAAEHSKSPEEMKLQLAEESKQVRPVSMEVLEEFEQLEDEIKE